ncbi:MAG TPA: PAS domain S-box protein [Lacunisphaera sp.]|nr:PAS domain S-box protein [Lacunisphaera sp.]
MKLRRSRRPVQPPRPEALLASIVDCSNDAIISKDLDGTITSWNAAAERIFGFTAAEMVGANEHRLLPPEGEEEERIFLEHVRRGERVEHFETMRRRRDGALIAVSMSVSPVVADGTIVGAAIIACDITEQKEGDRAALLLAAIVNSSDDAIISKDLDGIITSWNDGARLMFGYTADEIIGQTVLKLLPPDRQEEEMQILARLRRGERLEHFETIRVRKNGESFNASLTISPIKDNQGRIVGASKIARDITALKKSMAEREQLLERERSARAQAERANRMKDDFLSTVSHELRTPLNAILGWTEVIKGLADQPAEVMHGVGVITRNAQLQAQLIDDLLDLGRIASGKMGLMIEAADLATITHEAIASVQHAADVKHIAIKTVVCDSSMGLMGDVRRLRQVVWNLLANAIKFTPAHGRVQVTLKRIDSSMELQVADNGRGIDSEFLPHVFERFWQGDSSITRRQGGLGIGLSLVRQFVELHGGTVRVESPGVGGGATFTITLPVPAVRPEVKTATASVPAALAALPEAAAPAAANAGLRGTRILAVDDDRDSLEVLRRILAKGEAEVRTAASADEALAVLREFDADVILSDIGMPDKDGYELIRQVRRSERSSGVPAAALTALARPEDRMRALQAGFQTHVAKPVSAAELVAVVRSLASLHPRAA